MEKEKRALELRLSGKESQEQAYRVQIEQLKCELCEQQQKAGKDGKPKKVFITRSSDIGSVKWLSRDPSRDSLFEAPKPSIR